MADDPIKDPSTDDETAGKKSDDGSKTSGRVTLADVEKVVNKAMEPFKKLLDGDTNGGSNENDSDTKGPRTRRDLSQAAEDAVKAAAAKLKHEDEHKSLATKEKEEKKETESPPVKTRWSTRIMGW